MDAKNIQEVMYKWVVENFGQSEADDPSYNLEALAKHLAEKLKKGEHSVIGVSIDDFENLYGDSDGEPGDKEIIEFVRSMDADDWVYMAELMADYLYDGDDYQNAMQYGYEKLKEHKENNRDEKV